MQVFLPSIPSKYSPYENKNKLKTFVSNSRHVKERVCIAYKVTTGARFDGQKICTVTLKLSIGEIASSIQIHDYKIITWHLNHNSKGCDTGHTWT